MKKTLFTLVALIGCVMSMHAADPVRQLTVSNVEVPAGGGEATVTVGYTLESIRGAQLSLAFSNDGITAALDADDNLDIVPASFTSGHNFSTKGYAAMLVSMSTKTVAPTTGTFFTFTLKVASTVEEDYYTGTLTGIKLTDKDKKTLTLDDVTFKIKVGNPKTPITDAKVTLSATKFTYTGSEIKPTITNVDLDGTTLVENTDFTVSYADNTDAGTGKVILTGLTSANYKGTATAEFTIEQANSSITTTPAAITGLVYDGTNKALLSTGTCEGGDLLYSLDGESYSNIIPTGKDAGDYDVYYKVDGGKNYKGVAATKVTAKIGKATSTLDTAPAAITGLAYTGSALNLVTAGAATGGKVLYSLDGTTFGEAIPTATDAGKYNVTYKVDGGKNYTDISAVTISDIEIAKADAGYTVAPAAITDLKFTGAALALVTAGTAEGGEMQYSLDGTTFSAAIPTATDKGDYTISWKVVGDKNHNDLSVQTLLGSILPNIITVTTTDGIPATLTAEVTNEANKTADLTGVTLGGGGKDVTLPADINGYGFTVTSTAFASATGLENIILPETENMLSIADGALPAAANIKVSLAQLADYALNPALKQNFEAGKVKATTTAINDFFTLSAGVDVKLPEGTTAYACKFFDASKVVVNEIIEVNDEKVILANNGVLLKGTAGTEYEIVAVPGSKASGDAVTTDNAMSYSDNDLEPVIVATNFASSSYYALKNNEFHAILDNTSKVPAGKAVLKVNGAAARVLSLMGAGVTGIRNLNAEGLDRWYDLQGNRVDQPTKKGIYILNGRKVTIK